MKRINNLIRRDSTRLPYRSISRTSRTLAVPPSPVASLRISEPSKPSNFNEELFREDPAAAIRQYTEYLSKVIDSVDKTTGRKHHRKPATVEPPPTSNSTTSSKTANSNRHHHFDSSVIECSWNFNDGKVLLSEVDEHYKERNIPDFITEAEKPNLRSASNSSDSSSRYSTLLRRYHGNIERLVAFGKMKWNNWHTRKLKKPIVTI